MLGITLKSPWASVTLNPVGNKSLWQANILLGLTSSCPWPLRRGAERGGFEPPVPSQVQMISSQPPSTTRPPLPLGVGPVHNIFISRPTVSSAQYAIALCPSGEEWGTEGESFCKLPPWVVVRPAGLEPATYGSANRRSIQLSHGRLIG